MKESIKTVFQCDFCDKRLFRKNAMVNHEHACSQNPINEDACLGCSYCQEVEKEITYSLFRFGDYDENSRMVKSFKCTKLDKTMYPHKAKNLAIKYAESFEDETVMPNECEHFEFIF